MDLFSILGLALGSERYVSLTFIRQVAQRVVEGEFDAIQIAAEATGWYWWYFGSKRQP